MKNISHIIIALWVICLCSFAYGQTPANDDLCNSILLEVNAGCNGASNGDNTQATVQTGEPTPNCFGGVPNSVWYHFVAPASGCVNISTNTLFIGTNTDTEIALYTLSGNDCSDLTQLNQIECAQDINEFGNFLSTISEAQVSAGEMYYVQVSGWSGQEGTFCIEVSEASQPANDDICNATTLEVGASCNGASNGTNEYATAQDGEPVPFCFLGEPNSVWYKFAGPASGYVSITTDIDVNGTNTDTQIALYALSGNDCSDFSDLVEITCNQDGGSTIEFNGVIDLAPAPAGSEYYIQVSGWDDAEGSFCIEVHEESAPLNGPANDLLCNAMPLSIGISCNGNPNGGNTNAFWEIGEPTPECFGESLNTVWFSFVAPASGQVAIHTDEQVGGSNDDTELAVYELPNGDCSDLGNLVLLACDQDGGVDVDFNARIGGLKVVAGNTYYIQVAGWEDTEGSFCITVDEIFAPANDDICDAISLTIGESCNGPIGDNTGASLQAGEPTPDCFDGSTNSVWYKVAVSRSARLEITTDINDGGTNDDTELAIYRQLGQKCDDFSNLELIACNQDGGTALEFRSLIITDDIEADETLYIQVSGWEGTEGTFCIEAREPERPANDLVCDAIDIPVDGQVRVFNNLISTTDAGEEVLMPENVDCDANNGWCDNTYIESSVWFTFTAPINGAVELSLDHEDTDFDTQIAAYRAESCDNYESFEFIGGNDDAEACDGAGSGCNLSSFLTLYCLTPGEKYHVLVDGFDGEEGIFGLSINAIEGSPESLTLDFLSYAPSCPDGDNGEIDLEILGGALPYSYTWSNGVQQQSPVGLTAGSYTINVTDACGTEKSANISVPEQANSLTADAGTDLSICPGGSIILGASPVASAGLPYVLENAYGIDIYNETFIRYETEKPAQRTFIDTDFEGTFFAGDFGPDGFYTLDNGRSSLTKVDTRTGGRKMIGKSDRIAGHDWTGLAWDASTSTMYGASTNGEVSQLYTIDIATGLATPLAELDLPLLLWIAIDNGGKMYALEAESDMLYSISKSDGRASAIGDIGFDATYIQDADFDPRTNELYLAAYNGEQTDGLEGELRKVDLEKGVSSFVGLIGDGNVEIAAFGISDEVAATPYLYTWTSEDFLSDPNSERPIVAPSEETLYTVTITDACGSKVSDEVVVSISSLSLNFAITTDDGSGNGSITAEPAGGVAPYSYIWSTGDTTQTISELSTGTFSVTVTDVLGCTGGDSVLLTLTNIYNFRNAGVKVMDVYPNPSQGRFSIDVELDRAEDLQIEIYDLNGKHLYHQKETAKKVHNVPVQTSGLSKGVYILHVHNTTASLYKQIVIN